MSKNTDQRFPKKCNAQKARLLNNSLGDLLCIFTFSSLLLLVLLNGVAADDQISKYSIQTMSWIMTICFGSMIGGSIVWAATRFLVSKLAYFISFDPTMAVLQARLLKMVMESQTKRKVFADIRNVMRIDRILEEVRQHTRYLVVYMTPNMLRQMSCAAVITIANKTHKKTVLVLTSDVTLPAKGDVSTFIKDHIIGINLTEYSIRLRDIEKAYLWLFSPSVHTSVVDSARFGSQCVDELASDLLRHTSPTMALVSPQTIISG